MKKFRKMIAVVLAITVAMTMGIASTSLAFAEDGVKITIKSTAGDTVQTDTTKYTYYKILDADIEDASKITVDPATGESTAQTGENAPKVSYYVTTQAKATALSGTGLFDVTKDATQDKWYVALKSDSTTAEAIATALDRIKSTFSDASGTFAQTTPGGTAEKDGLDPGYYLITSTLGDKLAVQTLADVTINTKNGYPGVDKTIPETDKSAQIGDTITYTIPVTIPESAADQIVVTDTMTEGLTFNAITSVKSNADGTPDVTYTSAPATLNGANVTSNNNSFTITFSKATVEANKGKTITIIYTAKLNEKAVVDAADNNDADEASNDNTVKINYGNNFESKPVTVETDTQKFTFDKVDGTSSTKLPGAVFELQRGGAALPLIEVVAGETYRIATAEEIADQNVETVTEITTIGKVITVNGVDSDVTYKLVEKKAPTGYNMPANPNTDVKAATDNSLALTIENNKGSVLPSTGGIGTTIFYILGALLVVGCGIILIARRRMSANN